MSFEFIFPLGFLMLFGYLVRNHYVQVKQMKKFDFDWYKKEFPELTKDGKVICYKCKSENISMERLMQRFFMRRHVCLRCGTTLYFSQEQS